MADYIARLKTIPLFAPLRDKDLAYISNLVKPVSAAAGNAIFHQGDESNALYIIDTGQVRIKRRDDTGAETVFRYMGPGRFFGEAGILYEEPRNATVEAATDVALFRIDKSNVQDIVRHWPAVRRILEGAAGRHHGALTRFDWQETDEVAIWVARRNPIPLMIESAIPLTLSITFSIVLIVLSIYLRDRDWISDAGQWIMIGAGVLWLILTAIWYLFDWTNDYLVLTNRRIVHVERYGLIAETQQEVPIQAVQNVVLSRKSTLDAVLGLGTIIVETIGGKIAFTHIPDTMHLQERILDQLTRMKQEARREERDAIQKELLRVLKTESLADPELKETVKDGSPPVPAPAMIRRAPGWREAMPVFRLQTRLEKPGEITWRKHWLVLFTNTLRPLLLLLAVPVAIFILYQAPNWTGGRISDVPPVAYLWPLIGIPVALIWFWWDYLVWVGDVYTVTSNRIVDVERLPFGLRESRRESTLDRIQDVNVMIRNIIGRVFDMGDVIIKTAAGTDDFTFLTVAHPHSVQRELFHRLAEFRRREQEQQRRQRFDEMVKWMEVYNQLTTKPTPLEVENELEEETWE